MFYPQFRTFHVCAMRKIIRTKWREQMKAPAHLVWKQRNIHVALSLKTMKILRGGCKEVQLPIVSLAFVRRWRKRWTQAIAQMIQKTENVKTHLHQPRREHRKGKLFYGRLAQVRSKASSLRPAGIRKSVGIFVFRASMWVNCVYSWHTWLISYISIPFTVYLVNDV